MHQNDNVSPKISPRTLEMNKKSRKQSSTSSTNNLKQHHKSNNLSQQSSFKPNGLQNDQVYSSPSLNNSNDYGKFELFFYIKFKIALSLL